MPAEAILSIDQGTTNTKALLVNRSGKPVFRASAGLELLQPQAGFVEQDPLALWNSVLQVIAECARHACANDLRIVGIAISNQRETAVAWRRGMPGKPVTNAITWQCRRSAGICDRLADSAGLIRTKTGLPLDPLVSASKWAWIFENTPALKKEAEAGEVLLGTVDAWLVYNLTGGAVHATDGSNASRTALLNLEKLDWDEQMLALFCIPRKALPKVQTSSGAFGACTVVPELKGIPVVAAVGDSHAALVGHGRYKPGIVKATYGTGSSLMMMAAGLPKETDVLARTIAWTSKEEVRYALEGNIAMTGSAVQWVGEFLGFQNPTADAVTLANSVPDARGVLFVPAMVGLGAPHWDHAARGTVTNLGRSHTAAHLAHAAVDAIAYQVADVFYAMEKAAGIELPALLADGGASRNDCLMQMQADMLSRPVYRSSNEELSALGAAWLGGLTLGWWASVAEFEKLPETTTNFVPQMSTAERNEKLAAWKLAVRRARLLPE